MPAVVAHGPSDYRFEELPVPKPGPGEVVIRVKSAGICASDIKCYTGAPMFWGDENRTGYCQPPVTPGHEFVGEVVALGEGAGELYKLALGDHAISEQIVPCGQCRYCKRGQYWMCAVHDIYGFRQRTFGSWAEVHALSGGCFELQGAKVDPSSPRRLYRAAGLFHSRRRTRGYPIPGYGGHRGMRAAGARNGCCRQDEGRCFHYRARSER